MRCLCRRNRVELTEPCLQGGISGKHKRGGVFPENDDKSPSAPLERDGKIGASHLNDLSVSYSSVSHRITDRVFQSTLQMI